MTKENYFDTDAADAESLLSQSNSSDDHDAVYRKRNPPSRKWTTCAILTILFVTNIITGLLMAWIGAAFWGRDMDLDKACARWTTHEC